MKRALVLLFSLSLAICLFFAGQFAATFELLGNGVHSSQHGWLGPSPRNAGPCVIDIGKVSSWECDDINVFAERRFGCQLWLRIFGYAEA